MTVISSASSNRFVLSFTLALTAADTVYTVGQFAEAFLFNAPRLGGIADGVMASEVFMVVAIFLMQWPIIAVLSLPPALGSLAYQRWTGIRYIPVFILCGAVIGLYCAVLYYFTLLKWMSSDADFPDAAFFFTRMGPLSIASGAVGGFTYRRIAFRPSARRA